ncbi:unnamed protein product [Diamesa hyperborea]
MSQSLKKSEDILLIVPEVRFKKGDGTLYVMKERIAWMLNNKESVSISHKFADVKMQKISPEGKPKIQLQVLLHDGNSSTFHFCNKAGQENCLEDREKVKELIQQLLPNFMRKVDKELEEKNKLLTESPKLLQLYKDLVISQVITSEEFWIIHGKELNQRSALSKQDIGVSGSFLADIKPVADGCNGFKYNLTADIIDCIFKTYPAVKKKHNENVPNKLSESEFWTKFFQSHYFHRDRITTGIKDIFTECGKIDDNTLRIEIKSNLGDPLLDLGKFADNTIEDGFCSSATSNEQKQDNSGNIVHQSIIKRFNHHSFMVLNTCTEKSTTPAVPEEKVEKEKLTKEEKRNLNLEAKKHKIIEPDLESVYTEEEMHLKQLKKKQKIHDKIQFEDLCGDTIEKKNSITTGNPLTLEKLERYLYGPVPTSANGVSNHEKQQEQQVDTTDLIIRKNINDSWNQRVPHKQLVSAAAAVNALGELSPGGSLMRGYQDSSLSQFVPVDVEKELRNLYISSGELLHEFWSCFPPTSQELELKATKMHDTLQRFHMSKVKPFEDRAVRELSPLGSQILSHLNLLIQSYVRKFISWQERKGNKYRS